MLTHEEMIGLQAEKHDLIDVHNFRTEEAYVQHLIHSFAYTQASTLAEDKIILDLGCNTGYGSEILFQKAKKVVGVDVSEKAISTAKKQYGILGIDFQLIDGKQLPFEDNEFDMVISCQVIEHIIDYNVYFNELRRVLSPSGIVIFTTPNAVLRIDPGMKPWNKFHVREFDHSEFQAQLNIHFPTVLIMGLFAEETLYLIEKNRNLRALKRARRIAREAAKIPQPSGYQIQDSIRSAIKRMLPESILNKLRKLLASWRKLLASSSHTIQKIDKSFIEEHGLEDFFYRTDKLSAALDFFAVCSDDENAILDIKHKFKMD